MEQIVRFLTPSLAMLITYLGNIELVANPPTRAAAWKFCGMLFPALWLMSVGPSGLINKGGFLMRLFKLESSRQKAALFGLVWLLIFLLAAYVINEGHTTSDFSTHLIYGIAYAGLMSSLGVFAFLAAVPETK